MESTKEEERIKWPFLFTGLTLLITVAYMDNARGPLLPVLSEQLDIPYTYTGLFLTLGNLVAVVCTTSMVFVLRYFNEKRVTLGICGLGITIGILAPFVHGLLGLMLLGVILGCTISLAGAMCNIMTIKGSPFEKRGKILSGQQVMYGVGAFIAPLILALLLNQQFPWWSVLILPSAALAILAYFYARYLPDETVARPVKDQSKNNGVRFVHLLALVSFALYVGGEVLTSMWMATYLVKNVALSPSEAAPYVSGFFAMMAGTRLLSFLFMRQRFENKTIYLSLSLGIIALLAALNGHSWAFPLVGVLGPFFPLFMADISRSFPDAWRSMTILVNVSIQISLALTHLGVGYLTDKVGIEIAFITAPILLFAALVSVICFHKMMLRQ